MSARTPTPPTVLVIADDLKLVESLRGAFGSACQVFLSPSVETGLKRVANERLCAVLINFGLQGLDAQAAVSAVRSTHREVTVLGLTPPADQRQSMPSSEPRPVIEGCHMVQLPVDWKDLRHLLEGQVPTPPKNGNGNGSVYMNGHVAGSVDDPPAPFNGGNGHHSPFPPAPPASQKPAPVLVPGLPPKPSPAPEPPATPEPVATVLPDPVQLQDQPGIAATFLRDEAAQREQANHLIVSLPEGGSLSGRILRLTPHFIVCEMLNPQRALTTGWSTDQVVVYLAHREAYRGPARLAKIVNTGHALIGEWAITGAWQSPPASGNGNSTAPGSSDVLRPFLQRVRVLSRIQEVFKAVVADVASVLEEARQCLDRVEVAIQPAPGQTHLAAQRALFPELSQELFPVFDQVFARFEQASQDIPPDLDAEYHSLVRQRLHPLMMCAPFIHHIYAKPLGFAGDYAALQKLVEDPYEGRTLYARLLNAWLVLSPAGTAYRHRLDLLLRELRTQAQVCHERGAGMRVLSIGCGAANEVVRYLELEELSHSSEFTLVDFNPQTLKFAQTQVDKARLDHWRLTPVDFVPMSLQGLVMDEARMRRRSLPTLGPVARASGYDFIYCTGLFDYFSDRVCRRLTQTMHHMLAPGGKLVLCNFTPANPIRQFMKYILDWNLIHRTAEDLRQLAPEGSRTESSYSPHEVEAYLHIAKA